MAEMGDQRSIPSRSVMTASPQLADIAEENCIGGFGPEPTLSRCGKLRRYSINLLAPASRCAGTSSPSAFAVLSNGFEHDPEEAARVRVRLLRELAANRESLVATHLSFPSVCHVAVDGDAFRWVPGPWEY
jgi:hypothetical protein